MNRIVKIDEEQRKELVAYYEELIERINLEDFKKTREITKHLSFGAREWRKHVENIMHLYMDDYMDKMVVGTNKGYIYTNDHELINRFLKAKEHQFKALAYNCYNLRKSLLHKNNYTIDDYLKDSLCK